MPTRGIPSQPVHKSHPRSWNERSIVLQDGPPGLFEIVYFQGSGAEVMCKDAIRQVADVRPVTDLADPVFGKMSESVCL